MWPFSMMLFQILLQILFVALCCEVARLGEVNGCTLTTDGGGEVRADCSALSLQKIPSGLPGNTTQLLLNNNQLKGILPLRAFSFVPNIKHLDLSHNKLQGFHQGSFEGLRLLEYLNVNFNELCPDYQSFPKGTFLHIQTLKIFKFVEFSCSRIPDVFSEIPKDQYLENLVNIRELYLRGTNFYFGKAFKSMKALWKLDISQHLPFETKLTEKTFEVFRGSGISHLTLRNARIWHMNSDTFVHFTDLTTLNLACNNHMSLSNALNAVNNLPTRSLETLILDGLNSNIFSGFSQISYSNLCQNYNVTNSLKRLSLRGITLGSIDVEILNQTCMPKIEYLAIGFNFIFSFPNAYKYVKNQTQFVTNLQTIDMAYYGHLADGGHFLEKFCISDVDTEEFFYPNPVLPSLPPGAIERREGYADRYLPRSVQYVHAQYAAFSTYCRSPGSGKIVDASNNVRFINVSHVRAGDVSSCTLRYFPALQAADVSFSNVKEISDDLLTYSPNIDCLIAKNNHIGSFRNDFSIASKLRNIRVLDLSGNEYRYFSFKDTKYFHGLEILILARNLMTHVNFSIEDLNNLQLLDLKENKLTSIDANILVEWDNVGKRQNISFDLSHNPFTCSCRNWHFIRWLLTTRVSLIGRSDFQCMMKNKTTPLYSIDVDKQIKMCSKVSYKYKKPLIVSIPLVCVGATLLLFCLNRFKWRLRWQFYKAKKRMRRMVAGQDGLELTGNDLQYDAFVAYDESEDSEWVEDELMKKFAIDEEGNFKLCMSAKNFTPGVSIAENIVDAIDNSRRVILVISNGFLQNTWCEFEMQMALTRGHHMLIFCVMEDLNVALMSCVLRRLLRSVDYIEWSETEDGQSLFWNRLKDELTEK